MRHFMFWDLMEDWFRNEHRMGRLSLYVPFSILFEHTPTTVMLVVWDGWLRVQTVKTYYC